MKGGKTPIHIMRWAPADFENDEAVKLAGRRRNYRALAFYMAFINHSFMGGGDLPEDPERVAATLGWHRGDVEAALRYWLAEGKLIASDGRIFHPRVVRDVKEELAYRADQSALGKKGGESAGRGRPKGAIGVPLIEDRGTPTESIGPPAPAPAPAPTTTPAGRPAGAFPDPPALPPADRAERAIRQSTDALRTRLYGLVDEMAREDPEHQDPTELAKMVTAYDKPDGSRVKGVVNFALLTHERLEHSIADAEAQLAEWRADVSQDEAGR